jgi:hypothetical protein
MLDVDHRSASVVTPEVDADMLDESHLPATSTIQNSQHLPSFLPVSPDTQVELSSSRGDPRNPAPTMEHTVPQRSHQPSLPNRDPCNLAPATEQVAPEPSHQSSPPSQSSSGTAPAVAHVNAAQPTGIPNLSGIGNFIEGRVEHVLDRKLETAFTSAAKLALDNFIKQYPNLKRSSVMRGSPL